ncbi:MAG: hypothetical protein AAF747_06860 [Planctomycetota bacterium]
MDIAAKATRLQSYQVLLYDRALHPELFELRQRRSVRHGDYECEGWLLRGGHLLRFEMGPVCACELVTDQETGLPESGVVSAFLCAGERDYEHGFGSSADVNYITTVQTETLSENLYLATHAELLNFGRESEALVHEYADDMGPCASILDMQSYHREVHVQSYHLVAHGGIVLRTQTIFEHA